MKLTAVSQGGRRGMENAWPWVVRFLIADTFVKGMESSIPLIYIDF
jgi:hypothetical protein